MSFNAGFDASEIDELGKQLLDTAETEFPKATKRFMKNEARTLSRRMVKRAKSELSGKQFAEDGKRYEERFKAGKKVYKWSDADFNIRVYNSAPHAQLLEYGHRMVGHEPNFTDNGQYVKGYHIIENALLAYQSEFASHINDKLASQILKESIK